MINAIAEYFRRPHQRFAGAHIRIAFIRDISGPRFLTGCAVFREEHTDSRPLADYGEIIFIEEWVREEGEALGFISQLLAGQKKIGDFAIPNTFTQSRLHHDLRGSTTGWPTWTYISRVDRRHDQQTEINLGQQPLLRKGLIPYLVPSAAVNEWMFDSNTEDYLGTSVRNQEEFVTLIPDNRARFIGAQWLPGLLTCELELNAAAAADIELQIVRLGSSERTSCHAVSSGRLQVPIPEDADELFLFLVDSSNDQIAELHLSSVYQCIGKDLLKSSDANYVMDLLKGEDEIREFKPFMKPKEQIETQLLKSVIAFANTRGGRIYVGVNDEGLPLGEPEAAKLFKSANAIDAQLARLRSLLRENLKPVPLATFTVAAVADQPVIIVEVPKLSRICSTHENRIYIRKGATNRMPDPASELPELLKRHDLNFEGFAG